MQSRALWARFSKPACIALELYILDFCKTVMPPTSPQEAHCPPIPPNCHARSSRCGRVRASSSTSTMRTRSSRMWWLSCLLSRSRPQLDPAGASTRRWPLLWRRQVTAADQAGQAARVGIHVCSRHFEGMASYGGGLAVVRMDGGYVVS